MGISSAVIESIMSKKSVKALDFDEAQVVCGFEGGVDHGEVISNLERSGSKHELKSRCIGAENMFGNEVFIAFNFEGNIKIIKGSECDEVFPYEEYESPIKI